MGYIVLLRCATSHQEYRFLLPALPYLHIAVGYYVWNIIGWCVPAVRRQSTAVGNQSTNKQSSDAAAGDRSTRCTHTVFSFCCQILMPSCYTKHSTAAAAAVNQSTIATATATAEKNHTRDQSNNNSNKKTIKNRIESGNDVEMKNKMKNKMAKELKNEMKIDENGGNERTYSTLKNLVLFLLLLVPSAHFTAAVYLSRRHQVDRSSQNMLIELLLLIFVVLFLFVRVILFYMFLSIIFVNYF